MKRQVALHEKSLLPLAQDRSATTLAAYRAGGELQPWLNAKRDELDVHLAHAEHLGDLGRAWAALAFLLPMGALALLLFLDLRFPLLFWNLRHGLEVSGGEPTDWYYSMQRVGRITDIVGIFVLAALSFALH